MAAATEAWLAVVGIGEEGFDGLSMAARSLIERAEFLAGGERHLAMVADSRAERLVWRSPFVANFPRLLELRGRRLCVLASGDPMWFGIGASLAHLVPAGEMLMVPHPGAFSLAAARLGWPLQDTVCLSIHGRPLETVARHLQPRTRLLLLSEDGRSPARLAGWLTDQGFGPSQMTVLERLGVAFPYRCE